MRAGLLKRGMSPVLVDALVSLMRATKEGKLDAVAETAS